jgi:hypothetical protein
MLLTGGSRAGKYFPCTRRLKSSSHPRFNVSHITSIYFEADAKGAEIWDRNGRRYERIESPF